MQFQLFFLAASAALVSATAPTTMCTDGCNPIAEPSLGEIVPVGSPFAITWTPTTAGTVSIQLLRGPSTNVVALGPQLVSGLANTGKFSWTPASTLEPDTTHYGLQVINDADGTFQYSVQFGISNPSYSSASGSASASTAVSSLASSYSTAPGPKVTSAAKNGTASAHPTTMMSYVASTGAYPANSSIISPTDSMTVPTTLDSDSSTMESAAATSTTFIAGTATSASATATKSSGAVAKAGMSFGGVVVAIAGAVIAL